MASTASMRNVPILIVGGGAVRLAWPGDAAPRDPLLVVDHVRGA
jgi:hypothetical protein